jgi:hypothetical protein
MERSAQDIEGDHQNFGTDFKGKTSSPMLIHCLRSNTEDIDEFMILGDLENPICHHEPPDGITVMRRYPLGITSHVVSNLRKPCGPARRDSRT